MLRVVARRRARQRAGAGQGVHEIGGVEAHAEVFGLGRVDHQFDHVIESVGEPRGERRRLGAELVAELVEQRLGGPLPGGDALVVPGVELHHRPREVLCGLVAGRGDRVAEHHEPRRPVVADLAELGAQLRQPFDVAEVVVLGVGEAGTCRRG